jgi:imidazolonepropionase-like amidohydrolase
MMVFLWALLLTPTQAQSTACTVLAARAGEASFYFPDEVVTNGALVLIDTLIADAVASLDGVVLTGEGPDARANWNGLDCDFVDVSGQVITAGLVAVSTQLGVVEVGLEQSSRDDQANQLGSIRAQFRVGDGYNPRSTLIPVTRAHGITSATVHPDGGLISGQVAWVDLGGELQSDAVVHGAVAMSGQPDWMRLETLLDEVRFYAKNRSAYDQNRTRSLSTPRSQLVAMLPVIHMDQPLLLTVHRAADIEAAIRFQAAQRVRLILSGVAEGWQMAEQLAEAEIPVIVDPLLNSPQSFDQIGGRADNAALLQAAGVTVILSASQTHNARTLRQVAGNAVRAGLDHYQAILSITQHPAEVFGLPKRGQLVPGAHANVVIWSGDPLELSTSVNAVYLSGRPVSLDHRQRQLLERYRVLPGSPLPALDLPSTP